MRGGSPKLLGGVVRLVPRSPLSRILDDLALPGDGGCIDLDVEEGPIAGPCGDPGGLRSSPPPSIADIDIPGRWWLLARSRMPANGDAVGGPRGADVKCAEEGAL